MADESIPRYVSEQNSLIAVLSTKIDTLTTSDQHAESNQKATSEALRALLEKKADTSDLDRLEKRIEQAASVMDKKVETKADFKELAMVQKIVYGMIGLILVAFAGVLINSAIHPTISPTPLREVSAAPATVH